MSCLHVLCSSAKTWGLSPRLSAPVWIFPTFEVKYSLERFIGQEDRENDFQTAPRAEKNPLSLFKAQFGEPFPRNLDFFPSLFCFFFGFSLLLGGRFEYFLFFFWSGEGKGESEAPGGGGGRFFYIPGGGGGVSWAGWGAGGGEVLGGCLRGIWGGGGLNFFFSGAEIPTKSFSENRHLKEQNRHLSSQTGT